MGPYVTAVLQVQEVGLRQAQLTLPLCFLQELLSGGLAATCRERAPEPGLVTSYLVEKLPRRLGELYGTHCLFPLRLLGAPLPVSPAPPSSLEGPLPFGMQQQDLQRQRRMAVPGCRREPGPIWYQAEPQVYSTAQGHMGLGLGYRARLLSRIEKLESGAQHGGVEAGLGLQASPCLVDHAREVKGRPPV